jgi:hypothetical protein
MTDKNIQPDEARSALDSVARMNRAAFRQAAPPRWYGAGISLLVATGFALYALDDPGDFPALFLVLGLALFVDFSRRTMGASARGLPGTRTGVLAFAAICLFLLALFFGGIIVRRTYDMAWVPLLAGLIAGVTLFLLSESERRYYQAKAGDGVP